MEAAACFFLCESPFRLIRCALWMMRSSRESARVGSMRLTIKRREHNYSGWRHRRTSRIWPLWIKKSWGSYIELWECWTETYHKPGGYPDALIWGKYNGEEMLFWLEVDTGHAGREKMRTKYNRSVHRAAEYAALVGIKIIFVIVSRRWAVAPLHALWLFESTQQYRGDFSRLG
jgi:hypothetical protein